MLENVITSPNKIKVLCSPSDTSGVGKFRSVDPHVYLQSKYGNEFHVEIDYKPDVFNPEYLKKYQMIHFHRSLGQDLDKSVEAIELCKKLGIITIMDLDDWFRPTIDHPIYEIIRANQIDKKIVASLVAADYITTTTPAFADELRKINKNVFIFPNAINPDESQFKAVTNPSERIRIGYIAGSSHMADVEILRGAIMGKDDPLVDKVQYMIAGYDLRGSITEIIKKPDGKDEKKTRNIKPEESIWNRYQEVFTNNYTNLSEDYKKFLLTYKDEVYPNIQNEPYARYYTKPVNQYATHYGNIDVSLAPLKNHIFNRMKSNLKQVEAGFYHKALVCSALPPYLPDAIHGLKDGKFVEKGNCLLVEENRNHSDWGKFLKKLIQNPNWIKDLGENLYETVKDKYHIATVTKARAEFYKSIIK